MDLKETYNRIAEDWHQDHKPDDWWVEGTDKFISLLNPGDSVLDVGCGSGIESKYLIQKGFDVTGIDFSEKMIEIAKREVPEGKFQTLDLKDIDKLDGVFDAVFMQAVLLHVPKHEAQKVIEKIGDKLKSGGYFYIAVKERRSDRAEEEIVAENDYGYPYERFFSYYTIDEIKKYLMDSGFGRMVYENISPAGRTNWIQVIAQK
ncbi:MAG: class I SAM-dependent methyltransferase [bacterium]|nr:class I SAM-dependent methyltransferase [bacterium]